MYRSNQTRIKKEIPSLLLGRGQGPRPASSLGLADLDVNNTRGTVAHWYCSTPAAASPSALSLSILAAT